MFSVLATDPRAKKQAILRAWGGHDDHMHVRLYCTRADRFHGCKDVGPVWHHEKKSYKYSGPERYDPVLWRQLAAMTGAVGG